MKYDKKIGKLKLVVEKSKDETADFFANDIARIFREYRDKKKVDILFLTSGGSAFSVLDRIPEDVIGPYLTIGMLDERYDPMNKTTNYSQLRKTDFYKKAVQRGCRLIDTSTMKGQSMEALADFFEKELLDWKKKHPKGVIIATIGVGPDGHTAGIMPFPEDKKKFKQLFEGDRFVVGYDAGEKNQFRYRVTATITFLRTVNIFGVFIVGKEKGEIFYNVLSNNDLSRYPGSIIKELPAGAIYSDEDAMSIVQKLREAN